MDYKNETPADFIQKINQVTTDKIDWVKKYLKEQMPYLERVNTVVGKKYHIRQC